MSKGNPMSSSFPRHGARIRTKSTQQNREKEKKQHNQGQTAS